MVRASGQETKQKNIVTDCYKVSLKLPCKLSASLPEITVRFGRTDQSLVSLQVTVTNRLTCSISELYMGPTFQAVP